MFISDGGWADEVTLQWVKSQESHIFCGGNGSAKLINPNIHRYFQAFCAENALVYWVFTL
jgi:hypothetical protein